VAHQGPEGQLRCQENPCYKEGGVLFKGGCHDILEDAICGEEALGERLFVGEDGVAYCDCDEDWVRFDGRCYQQFTPAFCQGKNEILQLNTKPSTAGGGFINQEELIIIKEGFKRNFSCVENPCEPSFFPHRPSWIEDEVSDSPECYRAETDLTGCEVVLGSEDLLECCFPSNRTICINGPKLVLFSPGAIKFRTCGQGEIYSKFVDKCVTAGLG